MKNDSGTLLELASGILLLDLQKRDHCQDPGARGAADMGWRRQGLESDFEWDWLVLLLLHRYILPLMTPASSPLPVHYGFAKVTRHIRAGSELGVSFSYQV